MVFKLGVAKYPRNTLLRVFRALSEGKTKLIFRRLLLSCFNREDLVTLRCPSLCKGRMHIIDARAWCCPIPTTLLRNRPLAMHSSSHMAESGCDKVYRLSLIHISEPTR